MKTRINYFQIFLGILAGIILGMILMNFIYVYSFERILSSATGIINEVNIDINETEAIDRTFYWANLTYPDKFNNFTTTNYTNKECYVNNVKIDCSKFTGDEHFCNNGICKMDGVCPGINDNKTIEDCLIEAENKR